MSSSVLILGKNQHCIEAMHQLPRQFRCLLPYVRETLLNSLVSFLHQQIVSTLYDRKGMYQVDCNGLQGFREWKSYWKNILKHNRSYNELWCANGMPQHACLCRCVCIKQLAFINNCCKNARDYGLHTIKHPHSLLMPHRSLVQQ